MFAGWVYWIKQVVVLYGIVFIFLAVTNRRLRWNWIWFIFGGTLLVIAQLVLFEIAYHDPFYFFKVNYQFIIDSHISGNHSDTSLFRYFILLFIYIYHTGLLGWLALVACVFAFRQREQPGLRFVLIWCLGLIFIFTAFPISFSPLKFIAKQSNYLDIFAIPLALLTGWFLAQQQRAIALLLGAAMVLSGIMLAALEQQVVRVVTVNGRSAAEFAEAHPGTPVFGPLTAQRQSMLERLLHGSLDSSSDIRPWADLSGVSAGAGSAGDVVAYLVEDPQMRLWPDATKENASFGNIAPMPGSVRPARGRRTRPRSAGGRRATTHPFRLAGTLCGGDAESHRFDLAGFTRTSLCGYPRMRARGPR
jgi:hypothetical protein